jgi:hypothetical protein
MLIDWSCDARPESGYTTGVMMSTGVGKCERSRIYDCSHIFRPESGIRPKLHLLTEVGHTTEVAHTTGVMIYLAGLVKCSITLWR